MKSGYRTSSYQNPSQAYREKRGTRRWYLRNSRCPRPVSVNLDPRGDATRRVRTTRYPHKHGRFHVSGNCYVRVSCGRVRRTSSLACSPCIHNRESDTDCADALYSHRDNESFFRGRNGKVLFGSITSQGCSSSLELIPQVVPLSATYVLTRFMKSLLTGFVESVEGAFIWKIFVVFVA